MEHSNTTKRFIKAVVIAALVAASLFISAICRGQDFGNPRVSNHIASVNRAGSYIATATDCKALEQLNASISPLMSNLIAVYPHIGNVSQSQSVNFVTPGTYNLTYTGSPTFSSTGVVYNGSTQYANTGFTPANTTAITDLSMMGIFRRDTHNDADATWGVAAGGNSYMQIQNLAINRDIEMGSRVVTIAGTLSVNGFWGASWSTSTTLNGYYNGVNKGAATTTIGTEGNRVLLIGAYSTSVSPFVNIRGPITTDFVCFGRNAWSDANWTLLNTGRSTYETTLGR